jgi:hypothetical protein
MNMITRPEFGYADYFGDRIFIFSNSLNTDPIWKNLKPEHKKRATDKWDETWFKQIWDAQAKKVEREGEKTQKNAVWVILDDTIDQIAHTSGINIIDAAAMRIRHANVSLTITTQEYKRIPKTVRMNCSDFMAFQLTNTLERKQVAEEQNAGLSPKQFMTVCEHVWRTPYAFIYVKHNEPNIGYRFFSSFERMIQVNPTS